MLENTILQPSTTDWITVILAIITAFLALVSVIILAFYTYYTRKMQKSISKQVTEQNRQTEELVHQRLLGIPPSIFLTNFSGNSLLARNIGYGIASNVSFNVPISSQEIVQRLDWEKYYKFDNISQILPNESVSVNYKTFSRQRLQDSEIIEDESEEDSFPGLQISKGFQIQVTFQDIEGNQCQQDIQILNDAYKQGFVKKK